MAHKSDKSAEELSKFLADQTLALRYILVNERGPDSGDTPLHCATRQGNIEKMRNFLFFHFLLHLPKATRL